MSKKEDLYASPTELKGGIFGVTKISKKAKLAAGLIVFLLISVVMFAIATIDDDEDKKPVESETKTEAADSAAPVDVEVSDGQSVVLAEPKDAAPTTPDLNPMAGKKSVPQLDGEMGQGGVSTEDREATRIREERQRLLERAIKEDFNVKAGQSAGGGTQQVSYSGNSGGNEQLMALMRQMSPAQQEKAMAEMMAAQDDQNKQNRKEAFLKEQARRQPGYSDAMKTKRLGRWELKSTAIIPVALVDGINSDLPGTIKAVVTETVYDHTGRCPLIPQGTTAEGIYDSHIAYGQRRVLAAWNKLIFRDGSTFMLPGFGSADKAGYNGFEGDVNNHYAQVFGGAILMSIIGASAVYADGGQQQGGNNQPNFRSSMATGLAQQTAAVSGALVQKNLNIQPTIEQKPGYKFIIKVQKDMIFPANCGD